MTWSRREVLASLGVGSAHAILFACGPTARRARQPIAVNPELGAWLREAVASLLGAGFASAHALAVTRRRTTAALDVLGAGVARGRSDGLVLAVRDKSGRPREHVTNDLSRGGLQAAVKELAANARPISVDFGRPPAPAESPTPDPDTLSDSEMLARVGALAARDRRFSSRIVYAASLLDIDDARVWSVAPGRVLEQRLVRVRRTITRVAWHGTRPQTSEASRSWSGGVDAQDLTDDEIVGVRENALALPTARAFEDGEHTFALDPSVAASVIDAAVRVLMTRDAQRVPEVARRVAAGASLAPSLTVLDDPTIGDAYGGFRFDDRGEPARRVTLIERGRIVGRIDRERRPGHLGVLETLPAHVHVQAGTVDAEALLEDGVALEEPISVLVDPPTDRVVVQVARARERIAGRRTGRVFADVELVGELTKLLGGIAAVSKETRAIGMRDEIDGQPRFRSIETPWLRGRAVLRQRRRPA